jgi:hypothetical protein
VKEPTVEVLKLLCSLQYCFEGGDVVVILKSTLFNSELQNLPNEISSLIARFLIFIAACTEDSPRKIVLEYCATRPAILFPVFLKISYNYPLDARQGEDAIVENLKSENLDFLWDVICLLSYKNRSKFFQSFLDYIPSTFYSSFHSDVNCSYPRRCISKNLNVLKKKQY